MITFKKTAPGDDLRMGALLVDALARRGVAARVDQPWRSLSAVYLVAEAPDRPRVWITAHDSDGGTHYDIHRGALVGVTAVVSDEQGTRFVFFGLGDSTDGPVEQAEACAEAVAAFFAPRPS
ncbi:hypothetical protein PUR49_11350 [Streptomyces sp. BE147]|uniref:hypothetical protein n=1 Tax=Streptomyces sp. BE147 TaxID=3002524 RepID=UPI002E768B98|nr:hypothetical protein [Streptomyces sp. BE147]MEE1737087.1 hypothetical protein [Streptomyces sp. BE147]